MKDMVMETLMRMLHGSVIAAEAPLRVQDGVIKRVGLPDDWIRLFHVKQFAYGYHAGLEEGEEGMIL